MVFLYKITRRKKFYTFSSRRSGAALEGINAINVKIYNALCAIDYNDKVIAAFGSSAMAGLAMLDQKNVIAVTIIIVTAFKICISHRKNGLLNRPCT